MRITSEIFQVGGNDLSAPEDAAVYLISFGRSAALVDSGCGNSVGLICENIRACGVDPGTVDSLCEGHFGVYRGREDVRRFVESYL